MRVLLDLIRLILGGLWLALGHLVTGAPMCPTIIGIPLGPADFTLIPVSLTPFGRDIVDVDQAGRVGHPQQVAVPGPGRGAG